MNPPQPLTSGAALAIGLVAVAAGVLPMLAAFDIGPLRPADINGPPWLGFAAGGTFAAGGLAVMTGARAPLLRSLFAILALAGLAALGNWIAFGVGERICSGTLTYFWIWRESEYAGLACRIPFGFGALMTDAFLGWMVVATLQRALGGPPRLARALQVAQWLILASLAPLIVLLLVMAVLSAAAGAVTIRLSTGRWPRNEEFIARQKAKSLIARFKTKPRFTERE